MQHAFQQLNSLRPHNQSSPLLDRSIHQSANCKYVFCFLFRCHTLLCKVTMVTTVRKLGKAAKWSNINSNGWRKEATGNCVFAEYARIKELHTKKNWNGSHFCDCQKQWNSISKMHNELLSLSWQYAAQKHCTWLLQVRLSLFASVHPGMPNIPPTQNLVRSCCPAPQVSLHSDHSPHALNDGHTWNNDTQKSLVPRKFWRNVDQTGALLATQASWIIVELLQKLCGNEGNYFEKAGNTISCARGIIWESTLHSWSMWQSQNQKMQNIINVENDESRQTLYGIPHKRALLDQAIHSFFGYDTFAALLQHTRTSFE